MKRFEKSTKKKRNRILDQTQLKNIEIINKIIVGKQIKVNSK